MMDASEAERSGPRSARVRGRRTNVDGPKPIGDGGKKIASIVAPPATEMAE